MVRRMAYRLKVAASFWFLSLSLWFCGCLKYEDFRNNAQHTGSNLKAEYLNSKLNNTGEGLAQAHIHGRTSSGLLPPAEAVTQPMISLRSRFTLPLIMKPADFASMAQHTAAA